MRCEEVQQQISDCMDGGQELDNELRQHVSDCAACSTFERDCRELDVLLTAGRGGAPAVGPRRRIGKVLVVAVLAAAAVFVLALLPFWRAAPRPGPDSIAKQTPIPQFDPAQDFVKRTSEVVETVAMAPVRQEMASLAADARTFTRSLLSCLPSAPVGTTTRMVE